MQYIEGKIIIDLNSPFDENIVSNNITEKNKVGATKKVNSSKNTTNSIKIESNLKESENYSRKVYSDCGLVVRTKRKYISKFCDACQGTLLVDYPDIPENNCIFFKQSEPKQKDDYETFNETPIQEKVKDKDHYVEYKNNISESQNKDVNKDKQFRTNKNVMTISDYINKFITKSQPQKDTMKTQKNNKDNVMKNLSQNINELDKKLNQKIDEINNQCKLDNQDKSIEDNKVIDKSLNEYANKTIYFKPIKNYKHCSECGELYNKGFYLDDVFICRNCLQKDFIKYLDKVRSV